MKKQWAIRSAPPGQSANAYDDSDQETLEGDEVASEEEGDEEGSSPQKNNGLPSVADIAQGYSFSSFPDIFFCHVCFQHSFLPQVPGDRHAQTPRRMDFLDTVHSNLYVHPNMKLPSGR